MPEGYLSFHSNLDLHNRSEAMPCSLEQAENNEEPYIVDKVVAKRFCCMWFSVTLLLSCTQTCLVKLSRSVVVALRRPVRLFGVYVSVCVWVTFMDHECDHEAGIGAASTMTNFIKNVHIQHLPHQKPLGFPNQKNWRIHKPVVHFAYIMLFMRLLVTR